MNELEDPQHAEEDAAEEVSAPPHARLITPAEANRILSEYQSQILAWSEEIVRRRVRGDLAARAHVEIVPGVPGEVGSRFIVSAERGKVSDLNIRGFLFTLTERATMGAVQSRWRRDLRERPLPTGPGSTELACDGLDPESALMAREHAWSRALMHRRVEALVGKLPARERSLVEGRFRVRPLPFRVLGRQLGISERAARIAAFRVIRKLRRSLSGPRLQAPATVLQFPLRVTRGQHG